MVFRLVCALTSLACQKARGEAPAGPEVTVMMSRTCLALGTLLQFQQEAGEACNVNVANHATGAEKAANAR
jgi:hypothetical protein